jgi:hypothetical protein
MSQRDVMRQLIKKYGRNEDAVCRSYALAESRGEVPRYSNKYNLSPEQYARALYRDGERKGWF